MTGPLYVAYVQRTVAGKVLRAKQEVVNLRLADATYRRGLAAGIGLVRDWAIEPGAEQLRIAICDGVSDNIGSITIPLPPDQFAPSAKSAGPTRLR